jgi:hypothetical protein
LADQIIILGDSTIQTQGTWDQLKNAPSHIFKIALHENESVRNVPESREHLKLQRQLQTVDAAAADLVRRTGDLTVYSNILGTYDSRLELIVYRLLLSGRWCNQRFDTAVLHRI